MESGAFYNIDSESFGILRATGSGFAGLPYAAVSTSKDSPASDSDKVWKIHHNESDDTYRFEAGTSGRYLYHSANGDVVKISAEQSDDRSKWLAIKESLSTSDKNSASFSMKIYPNPAKDRFTLAFENLNAITVKIYNVLGGVVYEKSTYKSELVIDHNFTPGMYLVKVETSDQRVYHEKLIIK